MHRGTEPRGASSPPEVLTEDDDEPEDKRYDGKDQPSVADGLIVWGGGEPSSVSPARCRVHGQAWEGAARTTARGPRAARGTHSP